MNYLKSFPVEAALWCAGLLILALMDVRHETHFTICPFYHLGFDFCPGCGLGRSISYFFHGEIILSLKSHPLGIFAVIVLSLRIINLSKLYLKSNGQSN